MAGTEPREYPNRPEWLASWEGANRSYNTHGNRCPQCGHDYPDYLTVMNSPFYGGSDALMLGCRCMRCGLEFSEWWMLFEGNDSQKAGLEYQSTNVPEQDVEANAKWARERSRRPKPVPDSENEELMESVVHGLKEADRRADDEGR